MVPAEVQKTIRQVREEKGWDAARLAKHACLSVRQIQQLEGEPGDSFYSEQIRLLAAKKVLCRMGWDPSKVEQLLIPLIDSPLPH
jgi:hypothetical protein